MIYDQIRIVLVEPSHPGNIGGVARAMKNMGLSKLVLVSPKEYPSEEASARAAGADDVLDNAAVVGNLEEALVGCTQVCGTTARNRRIDWPTVGPRQYAEKIVKEPGSGEIAILFGRERSGLTNDELDRCQVRVAIPVDPDFSSLNLVCAVQVVTYEIRHAQISVYGEPKQDLSEVDEPVGAVDMERFYQHLEEVLIELEFLNPDYPKKLMRRLKRLFNRAAPIENEMNILRGILTAVQDRTRRYTKT